MALRWSPEQIAGRAKRDKEPFSISFPTIYRAINKGVLPPQLKKIMRFKWKHKKCKTEDKRGKEFAAHQELEEATGTKVYFCEPYSPWQRGTNENTNGLHRQFFPKGTSFADISDDDLQNIVDMINNRPRKRLNYLTPFEVLKKFF